MYANGYSVCVLENGGVSECYIGANSLRLPPPTSRCPDIHFVSVSIVSVNARNFHIPRKFCRWGGGRVQNLSL